MAYLWYRSENKDWVPRAMEGEPIDLGGATPEETAVLVPVEDDGRGVVWTLLWGARQTMRINGSHRATGIQVLSDRDEIKVGLGPEPPVFFSAERRAVVETFTGCDHEIVCPRCKRPIEVGSPVVACPICDVFYHHSDNKDEDCWRYSNECHCGHPTSMDLGFAWSPQEVWR